MTNRFHAVPYIGVTTDLVQRASQHRLGTFAGFTSRYNRTRLVFFESYDQITSAIQREWTLKHRSPAWKVALIEHTNPGWDDLYERLL